MGWGTTDTRIEGTSFMKTDLYHKSTDYGMLQMRQHIIEVMETHLHLQLTMNGVITMMLKK
jgi:hypothetical protein